MKIKQKLILSNLGTVIIPVLILGIVLGITNLKMLSSLNEIAYTSATAVVQQAQDALKDTAFEKLEAIAAIKKNQITAYFNQNRVDLETLAVSKDVQNIFSHFKKYHDDMKTSSTGNYDVSTERYKKLWQDNSAFLTQYVDEKKYGYYDVFIICAAHGHVMFTATKESDLGENLGHGSFNDSGLAQVWKKVIQTGSTAFNDFEPYAPSGGDPAAFIGTPILMGGKTVAVLAFQLPIKQINAIMQERTGMGKSGETYLVGPDHHMRSDSFLDPANFSVLASFKNNTLAKSDMIEKALAGKHGTVIGSDYTRIKTGKDNMVMCSYAPLDIFGTRWAFLSEIDQSEALAASNSMIKKAAEMGKEITAGLSSSVTIFIVLILVLIAIFAVIGFFSAAYITKGIIDPIHKMVEFGAKLNKGDLSTRVDMGKPINCSTEMGCGKPECPSYGKEAWCWVEAGSFSNYPVCPHAVKGEDCRDCKVWKLSKPNELEEMGAAINAVVDELNIKARVAVEIADGNLDQSVHVASDVDTLGIALKKMIEDLNAVFQQIQVATEQVNSGAGQLSSSASSLASGTTEQAASLEEVSSSMSEVGSRAKTNSENADQASLLSGQTLDVVNRGNSQMEEMLRSMNKINSTSSDISKIIKVIDEIAFQTNLLALNAAVEAARAGKYGKGFAVVAEEVRNLAARSAEAAKNTTELIENSAKEVESGVDNAGKTAEILNEIDTSITKANNLIDEIASASQEQSVSTDEMSKGLIQVNEVVQENSSVSEETAAASEELSGQATQLQELMSRFKLNQADAFQSPGPVQQDVIEPTQTEKQTVKPQKMITLDDNNFGKY